MRIGFIMKLCQTMQLAACGFEVFKTAASYDLTP